jgi:hypothetical protein
MMAGMFLGMALATAPLSGALIGALTQRKEIHEAIDCHRGPDGRCDCWGVV